MANFFMFIPLIAFQLLYSDGREENIMIKDPQFDLYENTLRSMIQGGGEVNENEMKLGDIGDEITSKATQNLIEDATNNDNMENSAKIESKGDDRHTQKNSIIYSKDGQNKNNRRNSEEKDFEIAQNFNQVASYKNNINESERRLDPSACDPGKYQIDTGDCADCQHPCSTCSTVATDCDECDDSTHMTYDAGTKACTCTDTNASFDTASLKCVCNAGFFLNDQEVCTACTAPCSSCNSATFCTTCQDETHMTYDSAAGTCTCTDVKASFDTTTLKCVCNTGFYLNDQDTCTACTAPCSSCNSAAFCTACEDASHMTFDSAAGTCICADSHASFDAASLKCTCSTGFYLNDQDTCAACTAPCSSCSNSATFCTACEDSTHMTFDSAAGTCICTDSHASFDEASLKCTCSTGFYLNDQDTCTACTAPCSSCNSAAFCTACEDSTHMTFDSAAGACTCSDSNASFDEASLKCTCSTGFYLNDQGACTACTSPCSSCNSATFCTACEDSTHMTFDSAAGTCTCSDSNASFDTATLLCTCNTGFYSNDQNTCTACIAPCSSCLNSATSCTACEDSTHMTFDSNAGTCTCTDTNTSFDTTALLCACNTGFYLNDQDTCAACISPCSSCNSATACKGCIDGYYLDSTTCKACTNQCDNCSSAQICSSCVINADLDSSTKKCICKSGYAPDNGACSLCPASCVTCDSLTNCLTCKNNAAKGSNGICSCNSGFSLNTNNDCVATCNDLCTSCSISNGQNCTACITNAELTGSTCACTANSSYDSASKSCVCNSGYSLSYNKCISCKKYLAPADVLSAAYSPSYAFVTISFKVPIDTTIDSSCNKVLTYDTLQLMGSNPLCSWSDSKTLKIILGSGFSLRSSTINLDGTWIVKNSQDDCTNNYQPLSISISMPTTPSPVAKLSGPDSVSLSCNNDPLVYSAGKSTGSYGSILRYKWSSTISSLKTFLDAQSGSSISIDKSSISSSLTVTVQVTNVFGLTDSASQTTTISPQEVLTVSFDSGDTISMKASNSRNVKAWVTAVCGGSTSTISWKWSYTSGPVSAAASNLASSSNTQKLSISSNLLSPGGPYVFTATATQNNAGALVMGSASISITVASSPLFIQLSTGSGDINGNKDFTVNANGSKDPDDPDSKVPLGYKWTCSNHIDGTDCSVASFLSGQKDKSLTISKEKLTKGVKWDLTCTVSKDTRTASYTITLNILNIQANISVEIPTIFLKVNGQAKNQYSALVSADSGASTIWSQSSGSNVKIEPNNLSALSLSAGSLAEGMAYVFTLTVTSASVSCKTSVSISSNLGAACLDSQPSVSPDFGTALTTSFAISISNCYDRDGEDYPLLYTFKYSNNGSEKFNIGPTTEKTQVSYILPQGNNYISVHVCDQLHTCADYTYSKAIAVTAYTSRLLDSERLRTAYSSMILDPDNIPSTIISFCNSATIDSSLSTTMWSDLKSYVTSISTMTTTLLQNVLGAAYSLTKQPSLMTFDIYKELIDWLNNILKTFPSLIPSQSNINIILLIGENYLTYGNSTSFSSQSFEKYVLYINNFYTSWAIAATAEDLVTQSSMSGDQNTAKTMIYNDRNFPNSMLNTTRQYSKYGNLTYPESLDYSPTDIMNMRACFYHGFTNDLSGVAIFSFGQSGTYENYVLSQSPESYVPFSTPDSPFIIELPFSQNISEGAKWGCVYYNETSFKWTESDCEIVSVNYDAKTVKFKVYHFSMYKLAEINPIIPPPNDLDTSSSCGDNYAPIYILAVILFIGMILAPVMVAIDRNKPPSLLVDTSKEVLNNSPSHTPRLSPRHSEKEKSFQEEESAESIEPTRLDGETAKPRQVDLSRTVISEQVDGMTEIEVPKKEANRNLQILIEGHLALGVLYHCPSFSRLARLFTFVVVVIFELLLEGLLYFGFEDTDSGSEKSTQTLFDDYEGKYFGCMILALSIAVPVEIFMVVAFSIDRAKISKWSASAIALGIAILIGSIIGIIILSIDFCHKWSGYWAVSFLWGILIEVFIFETIFMIVRYFLIKSYSRVITVKPKV
ncbi:unnamed protein product [Blepharisma stoltei]|uniref:EGF-like domain-containing protein n=1 Tax=Blepharisma stoltei TaxID=1481888 RepID=A0AAU9J176_9CILI|nr:unnamed protein product [Blepharisma stoltei]